MFQAILKCKDGKTFSACIKDPRLELYYIVPKDIELEDYIELTPNNIIEHGGFSSLQPEFKCHDRKVFELTKVNHTEKVAIYYERE